MSQVDEMGLTTEAAEYYEQSFVPAIFDQWPARMIDAAGISAGDRVLEVGCGTGVLAREAVKQVGPQGRVAGLDLSESMLSVARRKCPDARFQQGNAMALPFGDAAFDVVASSFMLMFVPDQVAAAREMWRVLEPGGRLAISVWEGLNHNPVYAQFAEIAKRRIDDAAGDSLARPFALGDDGKLAQICDDAGIQGVTINAHAGRARFPSIEDFARTEIQAWVLGDSVDEACLKAVVADSQEAFERYRDAQGTVDFPLNGLIVTARKG